jgi:hypothetical protein
MKVGVHLFIADKNNAANLSCCTIERLRKRVFKINKEDGYFACLIIFIQHTPVKYLVNEY